MPVRPVTRHRSGWCEDHGREEGQRSERQPGHGEAERPTLGVRPAGLTVAEGHDEESGPTEGQDGAERQEERLHALSLSDR